MKWLRAGRAHFCRLLICQVLMGIVSYAGAAVAPVASQSGTDAAVLERRVKVAYLYKFASYVEWPDGTFPRPDTPLVIAVIGDDLFADELVQLATGRTVDERPIVVRREKDGALAAGVHILFVGRAETAWLKQSAPATPTLIVTEAEGALTHGSAINFVISAGRVRFEVALEAAEKRRLKLSSRLLTVAQNVRTGSP